LSVTRDRAKKRLGQNFLVSSEIVKKIIDAIAPKSTDTIVEVGPGKGALTIPLAESGAKIIAVEFDRDLANYSKDSLKRFTNVTVLQKDFLKFEPKELALTSIKLCGNLPFNITSPVIDWIVNHRSNIVKAVIMMQKEVALRLASKPNSKDWSPLAIFTQLYFDINILFNVAPQNFEPSPKVTSAVVELIPKVSAEILHYPKFEQLVRASFRQRRKQLINNLVPILIPTVPAAEEIFGQLGLNRKVRAEEVSTGQFLELTELLAMRNMLGTNLPERK